MIILIIHIIVSYDQNISLIFLMWKMDPMSGFDIRLVFILPPRDSTLQYKRCVHFWNNFPCITSLLETFPILFTCLCIICLGFQRKSFYFCAIAGPVISAQFRSLKHKTRTLARNSAQRNCDWKPYIHIPLLFRMSSLLIFLNQKYTRV